MSGLGPRRLGPRGRGLEPRPGDAAQGAGGASQTRQGHGGNAHRGRRGRAICASRSTALPLQGRRRLSEHGAGQKVRRQRGREVAARTDGVGEIPAITAMSQPSPSTPYLLGRYYAPTPFRPPTPLLSAPAPAPSFSRPAPLCMYELHAYKNPRSPPPHLRLLFSPPYLSTKDGRDETAAFSHLALRISSPVTGPGAADGGSCWNAPAHLTTLRGNVMEPDPFLWLIADEPVGCLYSVFSSCFLSNFPLLAYPSLYLPAVRVFKRPLSTVLCHGRTSSVVADGGSPRPSSIFNALICSSYSLPPLG